MHRIINFKRIFLFNLTLFSFLAFNIKTTQAASYNKTSTNIGSSDFFDKSDSAGKRVTDPSKKVPASKGEYIDYFTKTGNNKGIPLISKVNIKPIAQDISFEDGLSLDSYQILVKDMICKKYPKLNPDSADSKYLFRALAENIYSLNGYLLADTFNSIIEARRIYFKIYGYVSSLDIKEKIKIPLLQLYLVACIYMRRIDESIKTLKKLKEIPQDSILFELSDYKGKTLPGEYVAGEEGENLYYICAAFYGDFTKLTKKQQIKVLDYIYSFNPTLTEVDMMVADYDFAHLILSLFSNEPQLLKYCVRGHIGWLILPKTIYFDQQNN